MTTAEVRLALCLEEIARREPVLNAFTHLDLEAAKAAAKAVDPTAPLAGLILAVKDNLDTADMPSSYGSPIYAGHQPRADAAAVAIAKREGAVVVGKTVTTEFAASRVGRTGNPVRPTHTPGGSSSGSAAAVASGMADVAFGTQTVGSVIRPAAFCGVVGFKPSFGTIPSIGLKVVADSIDTVGIFARDMATATRFFGGMTGIAAEPIPAIGDLKIAICPGLYADRAEPGTLEHLTRVVDRLKGAGVSVTTLELPAEWAAIEPQHHRIVRFEGARNMAHELRVHRDLISPDVLVQWAEGETITPEQYGAASTDARRWRREWDDLIQPFDAVLTPAACGEAPAGRGNTGDPIFNLPFSLLRVPVLTLPTGSGPTGLPLGTQVIGRRRQDARLLAVASALAKVMVGRG